MGGGGGGSTVSKVAAAAPEVYAPVAPTRTAAEAMPTNFDKALFTSGAKETAAQKAKKAAGASRLVIPIESTAQSGGYTAPRTPTGVV